MYTVLLVDDEQSIVHLCTAVLARTRQLHILQASSGGEAIDTASKYDETIELLLSDIMMPGGISGVELAESLTVSRPEIKVLLMSGNSPEPLVMKPGWRFLAKPFRPSDLLGQVEAILPVGYAVDVAS
jgi:two-component system, cell cycle sensor histidine kinase and response regulator CckA